jgi:DNA replication and repair protein RecF
MGRNPESRKRRTSTPADVFKIPDLIRSFDKQLIPLGEKIYERRQQFWADFMPVFRDYYQSLSGQEENIDGKYQSPLEDSDFEQLLDEKSDKDQQLQRTTVGIHKDDFKFLIEGYPLKKFGSQGQQKSFVYALKLTQYQLLMEKTSIQPLLLLDDVFDRLDHDRVQHLLGIVMQDDFGQVFLTDTQPDRIEGLVSTYNENFQKCLINDGQIL